MPEKTWISIHHTIKRTKKRKEKKKENEKTIYDIILSLSFLDNIRLRKLHADRINTSRKIKEGKKRRNLLC